MKTLYIFPNHLIIKQIRMSTRSYAHIILCSLAYLGLHSLAFSQNNAFCGSDIYRQKLVTEHPEILQQEAELELFTKQFEAQYLAEPGTRNASIIIPIVFHIIHQAGSENISDAQVRDQVRILNEDYNKKNADTASVIAQFKSIIADVGIEFRLANIDPWGNCTNGIDRINSCQTYMGNDFSKMNNWPRDKYLNVWVVRSMENGVAGYAYYPGSVDALYSVPNRDGVIILSNYIGSIGTGTYAYARALAHEIGHYLNLKHPWGDTNNPGVSCGDDDVNDTPVTRGSTSCSLYLQYCIPGTIENVQNFMDYSYCSRMFTEGQKTRMLAALTSNKSDRNNLYTATNLASTGTEDTFYSPCAPKADFGVNKRYVCLGTPVTLIDASYNGEITDYYWEFPTGTPNISTDKNPQVTFNSIGWQPVKLTVTNSLGTSVKENNTLVYVGNDLASYVAPFHEGFEDPNVFANNEWASVNYDNNYTYFRHSANTSHWGNACVMLNNYDSRNDHDIDELVSTGFDLSGLANTDLKLSFYYSLASWNQNFNDLADSIAVLATSNCGASNWVNIYKKGGSTLVNAGYQEGYFTPTQAQAYWKYVNINLGSNLKQSNVRFKFQVYSAVKGNNFYIDDINVGNMIVSGVEPVTSINEVSVFPNPASNQASIEINLSETSDMVIEATDLTGKQALKIFDGKMSDGITRIDVNTSVLAKGVYLVNVKAGHSVSRKKLVIE
jgi:PKD repeat protein